MSPRAWLLVSITAVAACDARGSTAPAPSESSIPSLSSPPGSPAPSAPASPPPSAALASPLAPDPLASDLASDLAARLADARSPSSLGPSAVSATVASSFLLVAARAGWPFDDAVDLATRALGALFHDRFGGPPARATTVFVFPADGPFEAFCRRRYGRPCPTDYGAYDEARREIVVNAAPGGTGTLSHELVHAATDFPGAPEWFEEGLATLYETPDLTVPRAIADDGRNKRHGVLVDELRRRTTKTPITLDHLYSVKSGELRGPEGWLVYAMAHDFCWWPDSTGRLWPLFHFWRDHAERDPQGRWSFAQVTGTSVENATDAWLAWVKAKAAAR